MREGQRRVCLKSTLALRRHRARSDVESLSVFSFCSRTRLLAFPPVIQVANFSEWRKSHCAKWWGPKSLHYKILKRYFPSDCVEINTKYCCKIEKMCSSNRKYSFYQHAEWIVWFFTSAAAAHAEIFYCSVAIFPHDVLPSLTPF